ncbi:MAG: DUF4846 domain-containing protein [Pseudomonadota bacterium]
MSNPLKSIVLALLAILPGFAVAAEPRFAWHRAAAPSASDTLAGRIAPPVGFVRVPAAPGSWAEWLRALPMKPDGAPVLLYTGARKWRQDVHAAVIDIDTGNRDLQQCADAIMRLRAEWLYAAGRTSEIAFDDTDGKRLRFQSVATKDYASFRKYMTRVFAYAGTYSLARELRPAEPKDLTIGDVFIKGGFPGHAVLVADLVEHPETKERRFLLLQSYMPAQEVHVLKSPAAADGSPWYPAAFAWPLVTPEWTFPAGSLKRWP